MIIEHILKCVDKIYNVCYPLIKECFMKDKFNRAVATGLLALMIANFSACDTLNKVINQNTDTSKTDTNQSIKVPETGSNQNGDSTESSTTAHGGAYIPKDLPGDVWKALKASGKAYEYYEPAAESLDFYAIPIRFLKEEGLLYYNDDNKLCINGKQPGGRYVPFSYQTFIDENTKENDVYVLLCYENDKPQYNIDDNVQVTTWKLKYTLDDDDYQALLKLKDDFRQRFFIQEMDNIYEPEVISKCSYIHAFAGMNSPFRNEHKANNAFPNVYLDNIDYDTYTITVAARTDNGYKFYNYNFHETNAATDLMQRLGDENKDLYYNYIKIETVNTILGKCLTKFHAYNSMACLSSDEAEKLFKESTREHELTSLKVNSLDNNFVAAR